MKKMVNGKEVILSAEEAQKIQKEWDANRAASLQRKELYGYIKKRRKEYPDGASQLEAICLGFKKLQVDGTIFDPLTEDWIAEIEAINSKYPTPE